MEQSKLAKVFKALSCEQRVRLLELVREWEQEPDPECCGGVRRAFTRASEELKISRSTLSHHFKELEHAGLITCVRNGQAVECRVNQEVLALIHGFLAS